MRFYISKKLSNISIQQLLPWLKACVDTAKVSFRFSRYQNKPKIWGFIPMLVAQSRLDDRRQIIVSIGVHRFDPSNTTRGFSLSQYRALIDTGATRSCLTYKTIGQERLQRHGKKLVKNVHNMNLHGLYLANIGIFSTHRTEAGAFIPEASYFGFDEPIEIMDIADNERFDAILGMDILSRCPFEFDKGGNFSLHLK